MRKYLSKCLSVILQPHLLFKCDLMHDHVTTFYNLCLSLEKVRLCKQIEGLDMHLVNAGLGLENLKKWQEFHAGKSSSTSQASTPVWQFPGMWQGWGDKRQASPQTDFCFLLPFPSPFHTSTKARLWDAQLSLSQHSSFLTCSLLALAETQNRC